MENLTVLFGGGDWGVVKGRKPHVKDAAMLIFYLHVKLKFFT